MGRPLIGIQMGAVSLVDEGVDRVLETCQECAGVNALFVATPTWARGTGGRAIQGQPLADHGGQEYDLDWIGGNYASVHPEFYGNTVLGSVGAAPEYPGWDIFAKVLPEAKRRGMAVYPFVAESAYARALYSYPNFPKVLEVDPWGRPAPRPCYNNPDYRNWHLSIVEDYVKSYEIDGMCWCAERPGPLNLLVQGPVRPEMLGCFCPHCQEVARNRGIETRRAMEGYQEALDWNQRAASGDDRGDGAFVSFWRLLLKYPELLAWQALWTESQRQFYRDVYGVAKACREEVRVGWHVYHNVSFSPFYRADQDYAEMARWSDFIKVVMYNNCAGPRFHRWIGNICKAIFADAEPEQVYPLMMKLLQLDEGPYCSLPETGFSDDYVRRETARAVARVSGRCPIYPGIDIDIPVGVSKTGASGTMSAGINEDGNRGAELTRCSPQGVKSAVKAAFEGGAEGVVLSRKFSEMMLDNLRGVGAALEEIA